MDLEQDFKDTLSCWASGVSVVLVEDGEGRRYGVTVSSFSSLSLRPPMILVCLDNNSRMLGMLQKGDRFAVSILADGQDAASNWFASRGREPMKALEIECDASTGGCPVVRDAAGWLECTLANTHLEGDHTILVGAVHAAFADASKRPLIYYRRAYRTVTGD